MAHYLFSRVSTVTVKGMLSHLIQRHTLLLQLCSTQGRAVGLNPQGRPLGGLAF